MKRYLFLSIKIVVFTTSCIVSILTLKKLEYFSNFIIIDNIVGMIPVVFSLIFILGSAYILFVNHTKTNVHISIAITVLLVLSTVLFPNALRGNWWLHPKISNEEEAAPDLTVYEPFSKNSKTAKLYTESTLQLSKNMPVIDGATALYPVYAAFAEATYNEKFYSSQNVLCTKTGDAYRSLIKGERDIIFVAAASQKQIESAKQAGVDLKFTPIGREAFVFLVGDENPINDLSYQQIRNIYSGKTAKWKTLGWKNGGKIIAFQRPEGSGSQTGLQGIMGELPVQVPQPLPDEDIIKTNSLMKQLSIKWHDVQPGIGYSYRYYATTMYANPDVKVLSINGIFPSEENIRNGAYPFIGDFYAVTNGEPKGNTKLLLDWILSSQGQELIEKTGYIAIY